MKQVHVLGQDTDEIVIISWENKVLEANDKLKLEIGDDFTLFYRNNNHKMNFYGQPHPLYEHPYTPQEKLDRLININPMLYVMIKKFDLVLTV